MSFRKKYAKRSYLRSLLRYLAILFLVLLQLAMIVVTVLLFNKYLAYAYIVIELLSVIIMFPLISQQRNSSNKIFWLCVVLVLPLGGHIMYQLWGREKVNHRAHKTIQQCIDGANKGQILDKEKLEEFKNLYPEEGKTAQYLFNSGFGLYSGNEVAYFEIGEKAFEDMVEKCSQAEEYIFISFFTIADGVIWDKLLQVLKERCKKGVLVYIMYDDVGSVLQLSDTTVEEMRTAGIEVQTFNPVEYSFYSYFFNYRCHQKIMIIDGIYAYTGGINASDRYANINSPYGHWKDVAVRIKGEAVYSLQLTFIGMYNTGKKKIDVKNFPLVPQNAGDTYCIPFADGPSNNPDNPALDTFINVITGAKEYVNIMTPYLIIDDTLRDAICLAAKNGVKVRIITPGIPDKKYVKLLTERHYGALLSAGAQIYEYTPGFVHAKVCMNESSAIVGTINMDFRSFFLHYENAVWIPDKKVVGEIGNDFEETILKSREITYEEWKRRPWYKKLVQEILYVVKCQL